MNYSFDTFTGDGTSRTFTFGLQGQDTGYIEPSNIRVYVDGVSVTFSILLNTPNQVTLTNVPVAGAVGLIRREMPKVVPYTDFSRGNAFNQDNLNDSFLQQLYIIHEFLDGFFPDGFYYKQAINMSGHQINNLGDPTDDMDAVNLRYLEDLNSRNVRVIESEGSIAELQPKADRSLKYAYFNGDGNLIGVISPTGTAGNLAALLAEDATLTRGASLVGWRNRTVGDFIDGAEHGLSYPSFHLTSDISGNWLDNTHVVSDNKTVMPLGKFTSTRFARNRFTGNTTVYTDFQLKGQGSKGTVIKHPAATGVGDMMFANRLSKFKVGGFTLDNTDLPPGTNQATAMNGQMWITDSSDGEFDDITFAGGDVLSFALDNCKNITCWGMKVDWQNRYPVGYSKSPLIVGDFSEKCMFIGGYVKAEKPDGTFYSGDLMDNDQANDTKMAFINLIGLTYAQRANATACLWGEGEDAPSNVHTFGMNFFGNGIGHGVSQQQIATDFGASTRQVQGRGVWNLRYHAGFGGHFIDNKGENAAFVGNTKGAVYADNAYMTLSVGQYFSGNIRDLVDQSTSSESRAGAFHSCMDYLTSAVYMGVTAFATHFSITNGRMGAASKVTNSTTANRVVIHNEMIEGGIGVLASAEGTIADVGYSTFSDNGTGDPAFAQTGTGYVNVKSTVFRNYAVIATYANAGYLTFEQCTFIGCTFSSTDYTNAKFLNCRFVNCTNAPDVRGYNVKADSSVRPSSARVEVTIANSGDGYNLPNWTQEARGMYQVSVGGRGSDLPYWRGYIRRQGSASTGVIDLITESGTGQISVTWPSGATPRIVCNTVGTYTISIS